MKTFISHSSKDKGLVYKITEILTSQNVWFDAWDMEAGDALSDKIEAGIDEAKNFLVILSKNSATSSWVKYELNMAIIKFLENEDYKIIVARIDDVEVPLRLKPFLRVDSQNTSDIVNDIVNAVGHRDTVTKSLKRKFVNRHDEINSLEGLLYDPEIKFISIVGFYGIGKTSLIRECLKRIYNNALIVEINLSQAHFGSRLTLELCAKAGISLPQDGLPNEELLNLNLLAMETLLSNNYFIVFNKVESILNNEGDFINDYKLIIEHFKEKSVLSSLPIIFLSTRWPNLRFVDRQISNVIKIDGLSDTHLGFVLKSEIEKINGGKIIDQQKLNKLVGRLHGYPLAARLAAPLIMKYGENYLIDNLHVINQLKIDIAEEIISKAQLSEHEIQFLEVLAIFEHALKSEAIKNTLDYDDELFVKCVDNLVSYNLLESNGDGLLLHPLVSDFYLKLARSSVKFDLYAERLAVISKSFLDNIDSTDKKYVFWLTSACRMYFYCGKHEEGRNLRRDLIGELKNAAIKLYQKRDFINALQFCNEYLDSRPDDIDICFYKARCLSRIGKRNDSIEILKGLISGESHVTLLSKYNYAIGRSFVENNPQNDEDLLDEAQRYFLESIRINEHGTALQSMGELLFRRGKNEEAASFIERRLAQSPTDPFALSIYSDILWTIGRKPEAIEKIMNALKFQPKNANFNFRAGKFLKDSNMPNDAYKFYKVAISQDETYLDARLSLCDTCLDLEKMEEAKEQIDYLKSSVKGEKQVVLDTIIASYYLKTENLDQAEAIAKKLLQASRNVFSLGLSAKVLLYKYRSAIKQNLQLIAESDKRKALDLINEGLRIDNDNPQLRQMLLSLS